MLLLCPELSKKSSYLASKLGGGCLLEHGHLIEIVFRGLFIWQGISSELLSENFVLR